MVDYKGSVIANPDGAAWGFACKIHDYLMSKNSMDFDLCKIDTSSSDYNFRDGEFKPKILKNIRKGDCFFIHDSNLEPSRWFTELCLVNHALKNSSAHEIIDVLPYLKFARQDQKDESRVPIGAKVVADVIGLYANRVMVLDVHNPAIQGFYNIPFDGLDSHPTLGAHLKKNHSEILENLVVMSPDEGGVKRARKCADRLDIKDIAMGDKYRKCAGKVGGSLGILGDVNGKNVLMVDDIIDSGGTLISAANACRENGAKTVFAYCPHGLFTRGIENVSKSFDKLFIGDTINVQGNSSLEVVSSVPLFAEAIYRVSVGESLSELFD